MAHKIKKDKTELILTLDKSNTSVVLLKIPTRASEIHSQNTRYMLQIKTSLSHQHALIMLHLNSPQ